MEHFNRFNLFLILYVISIASCRPLYEVKYYSAEPEGASHNMINNSYKIKHEVYSLFNPELRTSILLSILNTSNEKIIIDIGSIIIRNADFEFTLYRAGLPNGTIWRYHDSREHIDSLRFVVIGPSQFQEISLNYKAALIRNCDVCTTKQNHDLLKKSVLDISFNLYEGESRVKNQVILMAVPRQLIRTRYQMGGYN